MSDNLDIKVTKIKNRWHARLLVNNVVRDETACEKKVDVGWMCRELLRWFDKLGGVSKFAQASRRRQNRSGGPAGRIWYRTQLEEERKERLEKATS